MAEHAGIRALLAHPIDEDAARFYLRFGFVASPLCKRQLLLLLKNARRLLLGLTNKTNKTTNVPQIPLAEVVRQVGVSKSAISKALNRTMKN